MNRRDMISAMIGLGALAAVGGPAGARRGKSARARLGVQLYSVDEAARKDLPGTLERLATLGYRDIELPGLMGRPPAEIRAAMDKAGLTVSSIHLPASPLFSQGGLNFKSSAAEIAQAAHAVGARFVVLPMAEVPSFKPGSRDTIIESIAAAVHGAGEALWLRTATLLNEKAAQLKPHGLTVAYHNHNVEFAAIGDSTGWDILLKHLDPAVMLELDLGWIAAAGLDPVAMIDRHGARVRQLHVKDVRPGSAPNTDLRAVTTPVGSGAIDWRGVLASARKAGVAHYYVEQEPEPGIEPFDALRQGAAFLRKHMA